MTTSGYKYNGVDLFAILATDSSGIPIPTTDSSAVELISIDSNYYRTNTVGTMVYASSNDITSDTNYYEYTPTANGTDLPYGISSYSPTKISDHTMARYRIYTTTTNSNTFEITSPYDDKMDNVNAIRFMLVGGGGGSGGSGGDCTLKIVATNGKAKGLGGIGGFGGNGERNSYKLLRNQSGVDFTNISVSIGTAGSNGSYGSNHDKQVNAGVEKKVNASNGSPGKSGNNTFIYDTLDPLYTPLTTIDSSSCEALGGNGGGGGGGASCKSHKDSKVNSTQGSPGTAGNVDMTKTGSNTYENPTNQTNTNYFTDTNGGINDKTQTWEGNQTTWEKYGGGSYQLSNGNQRNDVSNIENANDGAAIVVFLYD